MESLSRNYQHGFLLTSISLIYLVWLINRAFFWSFGKRTVNKVYQNNLINVEFWVNVYDSVFLQTILIFPYSSLKVSIIRDLV